jgi:hypothetical protein
MGGDDNSLIIFFVFFVFSNIFFDGDDNDDEEEDKRDDFFPICDEEGFLTEEDTGRFGIGGLEGKEEEEEEEEEEREEEEREEDGCLGGKIIGAKRFDGLILFLEQVKNDVSGERSEEEEIWFGTVRGREGEVLTGKETGFPWG